MRPRLYIHVGAHKTGTTSLQYALGKNANRLRQYEVLYPVAARRHHAHYRLSLGLRKKPVSETGEIPDADNEIGSILREIEECRPSVVILSCEGFFALHERAIRILFDRFKGMDVKVVAYIRRQDDLLISTYNQRTKSRKRDYSKDFAELLANPRKHLPDYRRNLDKWGSVFGRESVMVRCYEAAGDVVSDFQRLVGIPLELGGAKYKVRRNSSISLVGVRIIRWLKPLIHSEGNRKRLGKLLKRFPLRNDTSSSMMAEDDRRRILELFKRDNEYVFRTYLNSENLYDPERLVPAVGDKTHEHAPAGAHWLNRRRFWSAGARAAK